MGSNPGYLLKSFLLYIKTGLHKKRLNLSFLFQTSFNVDNVRVTKILGSGLMASEVVSGMVFKRSVESNVTKVEKCKVAVYTCPIDSTQVKSLKKWKKMHVK